MEHFHLDHLALRLPLLAMFIRRANKRPKQRMGLQWLGLELGMELAPDEMWMIRQLHHLHIGAVWSRSGNAQAAGHQWLLVLAVEFVTMAVPLADLEHTVNPMRQRIRLDPASPRTQPHGSA